jgi:hypothetical protein
MGAGAAAESIAGQGRGLGVGYGWDDSKVGRVRGKYSTYESLLPTPSNPSNLTRDVYRPMHRGRLEPCREIRTIGREENHVNNKTNRGNQWR